MDGGRNARRAREERSTKAQATVYKSRPCASARIIAVQPVARGQQGYLQITLRLLSPRPRHPLLRPPLSLMNYLPLTALLYLRRPRAKCLATAPNPGRSERPVLGSVPFHTRGTGDTIVG